MQRLFSILTFLTVLAILTFFSKLLYDNMIEKDLTLDVNEPIGSHFEQLEEAATGANPEPKEINITNANHDIELAPPNSKPPHFKLSLNSQDNSVSIAGELASINEKLQLISTLTQESNLKVIDKLIISNYVTTIRQRDRLFQLCAEFLEKTHNPSLEWSPQQIKLAGEMKTEQAITAIMEQFENFSSEDEEILTTSLHLTKPPSLHFTLERLSNKTIILKGTLPSKVMGEALYQLVASSHTASIGINNKSYIANNLRYTDQQVEAWWFGIPESFIGNFLKQTEGIAKIEYTDRGLYIEGVYRNQAEFIRARSTFQSIPKHLDIYDDFLRVKAEQKKNNTPSSGEEGVEGASTYSASNLRS